MQPNGDERRSREAELLRPEQAGNGDVAAGFDLAVGLDDDAAAQVVHDEHLLRFSDAQFPRETGVLNGGLR